MTASWSWPSSMQSPPIPQIDDKVLAGLDQRFEVWWYDFLNLLLRFVVSVRDPIQLTQTRIAKFQASLTRGDAGTSIWVTDFNHILRWSGAAWSWPPGDNGSGFEIDFKTAGPVPATGWHACDGTVDVEYLKSDGTIGVQTVSNVAGRWFRQ